MAFRNRSSGDGAFCSDGLPTPRSALTCTNPVSFTLAVQQHGHAVVQPGGRTWRKGDRLKTTTATGSRMVVEGNFAISFTLVRPPS